MGWTKFLSAHAFRRRAADLKMLCLMLIQSRIVSRHELPALGCTRRLGKAETPSPTTPRCCIEEICDQRATKILIETRTGFSVITLARSSLGESSGCLGAQTAARKAHPPPSLRQGRGCCSPFVQVDQGLGISRISHSPAAEISTNLFSKKSSSLDSKMWSIMG